MKLKLLFLLFSCALFAQNPELFNNNWYISQVKINGQTTTRPTTGPGPGPSTFSFNGNGYTFNSNYYNTVSLIPTFSSTSDSFTKNSSSCTLAVYYGVNETEVQSFDGKCSSVYMNLSAGNVFNYEIINNGTSKTLIVTDTNTGNQVYYNNSFLSVKDNLSKKKLKIFPNPVRDFLVIENIKRDLTVKIYDISGKLMLQTKTADTIMKVNISNLQKGQYILNIEDFKPEFFIKN